MLLSPARALAGKIVESMRPFCERVEVAGSIRRNKPEVKDIEIVAIPKQGEPLDLFSEQRENLLYGWAQRVEAENRIHWIKPGVDGVFRWPLNPQGRYWRGWLPATQIKVDLFLATPENWGVIFLIRTGPADYSARIVSQCRPHHYFAEGRLLDRDGRFVPTPEECDVYNALGLPFIEPQARQ